MRGDPELVSLSQTMATLSPEKESDQKSGIVWLVYSITYGLTRFLGSHCLLAPFTPSLDIPDSESYVTRRFGIRAGRTSGIASFPGLTSPQPSSLAVRITRFVLQATIAAVKAWEQAAAKTGGGNEASPPQITVPRFSSGLLVGGQRRSCEQGDPVNKENKVTSVV